MFDKVKLALRVASDDYDTEIRGLIKAALADMGITDIKKDVLIENNANPLIDRAVITYCKMNFGYLSNDQYQKFKESYDEQKKQLLMSSDFTDWGDANA